MTLVYIIARLVAWLISFFHYRTLYFQHYATKSALIILLNCISITYLNSKLYYCILVSIAEHIGLLESEVFGLCSRLMNYTSL